MMVSERSEGVEVGSRPEIRVIPYELNPDVGLTEEGKVLRVLPSGRWLPPNQG